MTMQEQPRRAAIVLTGICTLFRIDVKAMTNYTHRGFFVIFEVMG